MIEIIQVIAMLCQIHSGSSSSATTLEFQQACQKKLMSCVLKKPAYSSLSERLSACIVE